MIVDTLIYVMVVLIDTTATSNRFENAFSEADRQFNIEMMKQASHEAAIEATEKTRKLRTKVLDIYRKED